MSRMGWVLTVILCGLSALSGWYFRGKRIDPEAAVAVAQAKVLQAQVEELRQQAEDSDRAAAFNAEKDLQKDADLRRAGARVQKLQEQLARIPEPAPSDPAPLFVARLSACEDLNRAWEVKDRAWEAKDRTTQALVLDLTHARDLYRSALDVETKRAETLHVVATPPKWNAGFGSFMDTRDHRIRPMVSFGRNLTRTTTLDSGFIPQVGGFVRVVYSWGHL